MSGHDLKDLEELLEQSAGKGVDIYTHSEMLPAQSYPFFKKFPHFAGNYGNAWWRQIDEFETFNGMFLFTSNCIVPRVRKPPTWTVSTRPVSSECPAHILSPRGRTAKGFFRNHRAGADMPAADRDRAR